MPLYEYMDKNTGKVVEKMFRMGKAPSKIRLGSTVYTRIISSGIQADVGFKPYITVAGPKGIPGCQVDAKTGRSVIETKAQEKEFAKKTGQEWM